ncbi:hypothetical protein KVT40_002450 [Elsinoe batatas]|uniref:Uncharacterized protein n=1 Tax=Elsinoe batatas TaxID=2601811 RepID=A0A8K0LAI4_9PEZI|nr:hypothetical protein KVT40_002450 [Elsinoe batatas]
MTMSPKRKRLPLTTSLPTESSSIAEHTPLATDSPRTQVASRFQYLEIQETPIHFRISMETSDSDHCSPRKRHKRGSTSSSSPDQLPEKTLQLRPKTESPTPQSQDRSERTSQTRLPSSPPLSPSLTGALTPPSYQKHTDLPSTPTRTPKASPKKVLPAGPLPLGQPGSHADILPASAHQPPQQKSRKRPSSPSPLSDSSSPSSPAFWQPKEITGHVIDMSTPDDADGLGINGIGFQPTAAGLEARKIKRRQQVNDWKAREAKEDRRSRFEKRGRAEERPIKSKESAGMGEGMQEGRRAVRFVDVGGE